MKRLQRLVAVGALACGFLMPAVIEAAAAVATGSVTLRTGPGTNYQRITTIPRGAYVQLNGCISNGWCDVTYRWARGWVSGRYVSGGTSYYYPRYRQPAPYPYPYPYYRPAPPLSGFGLWFGW